MKWENGRRATSNPEACINVRSPGVPGLEVSKQLIDPATGQPVEPPLRRYEPGERLRFRVTVRNPSNAPATGIRELEDFSQTSTTSRGRTFPLLQSGLVIAEPDGWRCVFVDGAAKMLCRPRGAPVTLAPDERLDFVFDFAIRDPIRCDRVEELCNQVSVAWRRGPTFGRACVPVEQFPR